MARPAPDESDLFDQHLVDKRIERDDEREPRPRHRHTVPRERQRNQARFADILSSTAEHYNRGGGS